MSRQGDTMAGPLNVSSASTTYDAGWLQNTNPDNGSSALLAMTNSVGPAVEGFATGTGSAGMFTIANPASAAPALQAWTPGMGPAGISMDAMLFFFWDDLQDFGADQYLEYQTLGATGGRVFNLYFRNRIFSNNCGVDGINVMISIHEGSGLVKVSYSAFTGGANLRGSSATLGFQTAGGTNATAFTVGVDAPVMDDNASRRTMSFHPSN